MIGAALAVFASGALLLVAPGALVIAAARLPLGRGERLAFAFATSLALQTAAFAMCLTVRVSIAAAPAALLLATTIAAGLARRFVAANDATSSTSSSPPALAPHPPASSPEDPSSFTAFALVALTVFCVAAAVAFAPVGSVDRWWYLAYVRGFLVAPSLTLAEPFLGTGQAFARFGVHPWLFGLASWSSLSGVDPVVVYERAAPVLVVLVSVSAAWVLASTLFSRSSHARLAVLATMLLWSGAMVPLLARAGEDKVMASAALLPLCFAAFLRALRSGGRGTIALLFACAVATAAVHALAYAFVLVALLPMAAWTLVVEPTRRRTTIAATAVLLLVAVAPALSGIVVRTRLHDIGAELSSPDHPVVRVHEGRERLVEISAVGYVVNPRLLWHPLALLALLGLPFVIGQRSSSPRSVQDDNSASPRLPNAEGPSSNLAPSTTRFLVVATALPIAIAFLPPLPALAGSLIPPWMVYRVLWLLPLAPLSALVADAVALRCLPAHREAAAAAILLAIALPVVAVGARERLNEMRGRLAVPVTADFRGAIAAIAALPADSLLVAAPELSERLPSFTGRAVVAALDRSTIVFSGSRERGEARLRARAALLAGDDDGDALAEAAGIRPTHAIFESHAAAKPECEALLFQSANYTLCRLAHRQPEATLPLPAAGGPSRRDLARADCDTPPQGRRRDPWSAAAAVVDCHLKIPLSARGRDDLVVVVSAITGRATDEVRLRVATADGVRRATVRTGANAAFTVGLPRLDTSSVEIRLESSFLPALKPISVTLAER